MPDAFVRDERRRQALWSASEALEQKAFGARSALPASWDAGQGAAEQGGAHTT